MDLAGLAALLAVPTGLLSFGVTASRERALTRRLQGVEKVLAEGTLAGRPRMMMENARDHLAERIAVRELTPRWTELLWVGGLFFTLGLAVVAWTLFDPSFDGDSRAGAYRWFGWITYAIGLIAIGSRGLIRVRWLVNHRDSNYVRDDAMSL